METALLVAAVLVAGLACPVMMWWQRRRGRQAACCPPMSASGERGDELDELRSDNEALSARLAELGAEPRPASPGAPSGHRDG